MKTGMAIFLSILSLITACPSYAGAHTGEIVTLEEAIKIALKESPVILSKANELGASKQGIKAAKGLLLPRIDAYSSYSRLSDPQVVVPIKSFGGTPPTFSRDQYRTGLSLKIPIYEGGRLRTQIGMAELSKRISEESLKITRQELIYAITNVFNQVLFLEGLENAQKETLNALKKVRVDARTRLDVGRLAPVELMRIDTQVSEQEQALVRTREEKARALYTLSQLMGRSPSMINGVEGRLKEPWTADKIDRLEPSPSEIEKMIEARPDIKKATEAVTLAERAVRLEKGLHLPSIDLVGDYGRRAGSGFDRDEEVWSGGVTIGLNIFSGGVISARVKGAQERLLAARNDLNNLRLVAFREIKDALSRIKEARHRFETSRIALNTSKESFRIEELKYETGAGTITDSLLAQAAWLRTRANMLQALFDFHDAVADYRLALGTIDREFRRIN